jgi:hypothetical protein
MKQALPKLAPYIRVSSQNQKNEETIYRQVDIFKQAWEKKLSSDFELLPRFYFLDQSKEENRYFIDEAYNLETWDAESACHDLMVRCQRGEVQAIFPL